MSDLAAKLVGELGDLSTTLYQKDFLLTWLQSDADLKAVLTAAELLEELYRRGVSTRVFDSGLAVSNFRDKSTRTRFSFASAASLLGLTPQDLDEQKSQVAHGETVRETATMISFLTEVIGIRDDLYVGDGHEYMCQVADAVERGFADGVLPQRPAVVNLQCDRDHPTQVLADLLHLTRVFGSLEALRGKRLAMTWAYSPSYGKPLSVPQGVIALMPRFGIEVVLANPPGYGLLPEIVDIARQHARESGGRLTLVDSMEAAFDRADIVYPKSWAPLSIMQRRTDLLHRGDARSVERLERVALAENERHADWQCTEELMKATRDGRALYMHCLPADISGVSCERGEVAASVFDRYRNDTYREAGHKPFIIAAMILLTRCERPAELLARIAREAPPRRGAVR